MQRLLATILMPLILFQGMHLGINDLVQIDELIEHARFHQEQYGDNFFVFLSKHYGELKAEHEKNHQEEVPEHEQLPFQYSTQTGMVLAVFDHTASWDITLSTQPSRSDINSIYRDSPSDPFSRGVFQPPQFA